MADGGVTALVFEYKSKEWTTLDPPTIEDRLHAPGSIVWLDVDHLDQEGADMLGPIFGFHELALEDALHPHQRPKIDRYGDHDFLVAYALTLEGDEVRGHEMAVFVAHDFLVTVRTDPVFDQARVIERWDSRPELQPEGGGYLLYLLLDEIVDGYFVALDELGEAADDLEERVFGDGDPAGHQGDIFRMKKGLMIARKIMAPLREVLDVLQRSGVEIVTATLEPYFRDVYDHVLRATDVTDGLRDILSSVLEANLSLISNRMNEVMKSLTAWGAIILVPTFVAGLYGMNFRHMPELGVAFGYPAALALMLVSALALHRSFKRRGWL
ncbi:MAG: magnesium/cobalt transporter CorA [Actinomycetota bacterium]|nr:magnesium/cobalt transporter CorA [Actinomycetota bacterium]